jgi:hypothetical protein
MIPFNLSLSSFNGSVIAFGVFDVKQKIYGPLTVTAEAGRCSLDLNNCESFMNINMKQTCSAFQNSSYAVSRNMNPQIKCPIAVGNYTLNRTQLNLQFLSYLPLHGFIFDVVLKLVSNPSKKTKIIPFCLKLEVKVERKRVSS